MEEHFTVIGEASKNNFLLVNYEESMRNRLRSQPFSGPLMCLLMLLVGGAGFLPGCVAPLGDSPNFSPTPNQTKLLRQTKTVLISGTHSGKFNPESILRWMLHSSGVQIVNDAKTPVQPDVVIRYTCNDVTGPRYRDSRYSAFGNYPLSSLHGRIINCQITITHRTLGTLHRENITGQTDQEVSIEQKVYNPRSDSDELYLNAVKDFEYKLRRTSIRIMRAPGSTPFAIHILEYLPNKKMPTCPGGGKYKFNAVGEKPSCELHGTRPD